MTIGHRVTGPEDTVNQLKVLQILVQESENKECPNAPMHCV